MDAGTSLAREAEMIEFVNRMALQREILHSVNSRMAGEQLAGLSASAIDRWAAGRDSSSRYLTEALRAAAEKLSLLANRSQDQISDDYRLLLEDIRHTQSDVMQALNHVK